MWYLSFCSPFRYQALGQLKTGRYIMYSQLLVLFLVYVINIVLFKLKGSYYMYMQIKYYYLPDTKIKKNNLEEKILLQEDDQGYGIPQKKFKQWYTHYFGIHCVAVGACIMYSAYLPQYILTLIHFGLFLTATILNNLTKKGLIAVIYNLSMILSCGINIVLFFSAAMGVGAAGYDQREKICYLARNSI